ncbi:MAG: protein BatD [Gammaproteobacteria bacterium]|nr:protein BatD [Gammaproteobacteria bacterium]
MVRRRLKQSMTAFLGDKAEVLKALVLMAGLVLCSVQTAQANSVEASPSKASASQLSQVKVKVRPTEVMLGQRVTVTIEGESLDASFERLDWREYQKYFVLYDTEVDSDRIRVKFYPLAEGTFTLKGQSSGAIHLPTVTVTVKENPEVAIDWHAPKTELYPHQQVIWGADVKVTNSAHKISFEARADKQNLGAKVVLQTQPFESEVGLLGDYSGKVERFAASYELNSLTSPERAQVVLNSPIVRVKNRTNTRWYFFDQARLVNVNPLPHFLPATVAVGAVSASSKGGDWLQASGELQYWRIKLEALGVSKAYLNSVAHALVAQIPHSPNIEWLSDSRSFESELTLEGIKSHLELRLPYRIIQPGLVTLPTLQLRYFNAETGKLETDSVTANSILALPIWLLWVAQWLILIAGLLGGFVALRYVQQQLYVWQLKRAIAQASSLSELWDALQAWQYQQTQKTSFKSSMQGLTTEQATLSLNTQSLGQWQAWVEKTFGASSGLTTLVKKLNQMLYANTQMATSEQGREAGITEDWSAVKSAAQQWVETEKLTQSGLLTKMLTRQNVK